MEIASPASSPGRRLYVGLAMTFSALVVLSPILGTKVVDLAGIKFTAGIFTILFAFGLLDVVNELFGKREARFLVVAVFILRIAIFLAVIPALLGAPAHLEPAGYSGVLRMSIRTFVASEILTLVQNLFLDIPIFNRLKKARGGFFLRANVSNIISWTFGTFCFVLISFGGRGRPLLPIIAGQTIVKFPLSALYAWAGLAIVRAARKSAAIGPASNPGPPPEIRDLS